MNTKAAKHIKIRTVNEALLLKSIDSFFIFLMSIAKLTVIPTIISNRITIYTLFVDHVFMHSALFRHYLCYLVFTLINDWHNSHLMPALKNVCNFFGDFDSDKQMTHL